MIAYSGGREPIPAGPADGQGGSSPAAIGRRCTGTLPPVVILGPHYTLGNQAVQRLLCARALLAKLPVTAPHDQVHFQTPRTPDNNLDNPLPRVVE